MRQWGIVWKKEMQEAWNNRKWIWLPLVFLLLGVMQPVTTHFMPQILKMSGSMPAGTIIHIPTPTAAAVFAKAQGQYSTIGLLVLVLAFMGTVSNERQHGVLELVMVKPVSYAAYILAKWAAAASLTLAALFLGDLAAWYYTVQLIGPLPLAHALASALVYAPWLLLVVTLTVFFSTWMNSAVGNAFLSLMVAAALSVLAGVLAWKWSPGALPTYAAHLAAGAVGAGGGVAGTGVPGHAGAGADASSGVAVAGAVGAGGSVAGSAASGAGVGAVGVDSAALWWAMGITMAIMVGLIIAGVARFRRRTFVA